MNTNEPVTEPASFSLGTLFLIVTCIGVALLTFRIPGGTSFTTRIALAMLFVSVFLALWFLVTKQFDRLSLAAIAFVIGLLLSAFSSGGPTNLGPRHIANCPNNVKQLGLALLAYEHAYGSFPPAYVADAKGKPLYSWRVLILPQLDNTNLARQIRSDEAWDSPNNAKWTAKQLAVFNCPNDRQPAKSSPAMTSYVAVVGPHTAWTGTKPRKLSDFKDPSKTILLVEVANSGIHWAEPRDLYIGQMPMAINPKVGQGISSEHPGGVNAVFADGHVEFLPDATDPKKLAEVLDLDGGTTD